MSTEFYINLNTTQISGLSYMQDTKSFWGLEIHLVDGKKKYKMVELKENWVRATFDQIIIKKVMENSTKERNRFAKIPIGSGTLFEKENNNELSSSMASLNKRIDGQDINYPKIAYRQNGEDTCVFASIGSAIYWMEMEDVALQIDDYRRKVLTDLYQSSFENLMGLLVNFLKSECHLYFRKRYLIQKILNPSTFDLLKNAREKPNILYHVVLFADDGSANHAVAIINHWIFDGNYMHALKLSRANLDKSCKSKYIGIHNGYKYIST